MADATDARSIAVSLLRQSVDAENESHLRWLTREVEKLIQEKTALLLEKREMDRARAAARRARRATRLGAAVEA